MKAIAPGTVIFHRHKGYGVITAVNLMTGWVSARFGAEKRTLDLNLSCAEVEHACGEPIRFRLHPPDRMPHARLMAMLRILHAAGYQRLYLYNWPQASSMHWRWHIFTGPRNWMQRPLRNGWYGQGADYNFNPVMGWGDQPGASAEELALALAQFDPQGLAQALGRDDEHTEWFANCCDALQGTYFYSLDMQGHLAENALPPMPIIAVKHGLAPYNGARLDWPPGWANLWPHRRELRFEKTRISLVMWNT